MAQSVCHAPLELSVSEVLPEICTEKKCDFLKPIILPQIFTFLEYLLRSPIVKHWNIT